MGKAVVPGESIDSQAHKRRISPYPGIVSGARAVGFGTPPLPYSTVGSSQVRVRLPRSKVCRLSGTGSSDLNKVLNELKELERQRRQIAANRAAAIANATDADRGAEADALARAAADDRARAAAESRKALAVEHMVAAQRRKRAEDLAAEHALSRAAAEKEAEAEAAQQAHVERLAEISLRTRVEAEKRALADVRHREFAASELALAAVARANRQEELARLAGERIAAEKRTANLAAEKIRAEQIAEAGALSVLSGGRKGDGAGCTPSRRKGDRSGASCCRASRSRARGQHGAGRACSG